MGRRLAGTFVARRRILDTGMSIALIPVTSIVEAVVLLLLFKKKVFFFFFFSAIKYRLENQLFVRIVEYDRSERER